MRDVAPPLIDAVGVMPYEVPLLGGALAREPRHRSAFCHRDAACSLAVIGVLVPPAGDAVVGHAGL